MCLIGDPGVFAYSILSVLSRRNAMKADFSR